MACLLRLAPLPVLLRSRTTLVELVSMLMSLLLHALSPILSQSETRVRLDRRTKVKPSLSSRLLCGRRSAHPILVAVLRLQDGSTLTVSFSLRRLISPAPPSKPRSPAPPASFEARKSAAPPPRFDNAEASYGLCNLLIYRKTSASRIASSLSSSSHSCPAQLRCPKSDSCFRDIAPDSPAGDLLTESHQPAVR